MKLLIEQNFQDVGTIVEAVEVDGKKEKQYYIEGVFCQADTPNRNGRSYPLATMQKEVARYVKEAIEPGYLTACGELEHPERPNVSADRISHRILSLTMEGKNGMGRAKILETPCGKIVQSLLDEGLKLGVSTRGLGSVTEQNAVNVVGDDFRLSTVDIVTEPSCRDAVVESIMEGKSWAFVDGHYIEVLQDSVKKANKKQLDEAKTRAFRHFMNSLQIRVK
jgi:hypothetical protein